MVVRGDSNGPLIWIIKIEDSDYLVRYVNHIKKSVTCISNNN